MASTHLDSISVSSETKQIGENQHETPPIDDLNRTTTIDIENYQGLTVKTVLVYFSLLLIGFGQVMNVVGAGLLARNIAAVVGGSSQTTWLSQAIVFTTVVLVPIVSQAADYWGRKWFLCVLTAFGFVGAIIMSRATSMGMAIAGEIVIGFAYGGQSLYYAVASEILPRRWRPAAQAGITAAQALGGIAGILAGSALVETDNEGFRTYWYILAGVFALGALLCGFVYNPPPRPLQLSLMTTEKFGRLDWGGLTLLTLGTILFIIALSWAENPYSWTDVHVLALLLIGAAILIAFFVHQIYFKKDGLCHHGLFANNRNFAIALFVIFVEGMAFFAANTYFAFQVSVLYETDPFRVGLRFMIVFLATIVASGLISVYSSIRKTIRLPIILSFVLFATFYVCMATAGISSSSAVWVYPIFLGFGLGFGLACIVTIAQLSSPPALIALTSGLLISIRSFGGSIALAICSAIFNSLLSTKLPAEIAAQVLPLGLSPDVLPQFIGALASQDQVTLIKIPGVTPQIIGAGVLGLQNGYIGSFRGVWIFACVMSFGGAVAACFFVNPAKQMNMHVDAPLEEYDAREEKNIRV